MLRYMLDTNICIYGIKGQPATLREKFNQTAEHLCISSVVLAELLFGAENSNQRQNNLRGVEQFAARLEILAFGPKAAAHYGQIRAHLERAGTPVGAHDMLIGAHARSEGLTIVTNNTREFTRMPGLTVENWVASPTS